jgi:hypothetical protein
MPPVEFEPTIPASARPQTYALDRAAEPIPRPEESYRLWCVSECDQVNINNLDTYCE